MSNTATDTTSETEIVLLALSTGEHVITEVSTDQSRGFYICTKPFQIGGDGQPDANGSVKMGIAPFMPYADVDRGLMIPLNMAILALPTAALKAAYQKATGMIITPPTPKIILG